MEKDDNGTVKFDNQVTLTPFTDTGKEGDIVDVVRQIISGENPKKELERLATNDAKESDETEEEENADDVEKKPKTKKIGIIQILFQKLLMGEKLRNLVKV